MTADTATITFTIAVKDSSGNTTNYTKVQTFSKSKQGVVGDEGKGTTTVYLLNTGFGQPSTPSSGTDETPGSWTTTVPTAASGSKFYGTFGVSALPAAEGTDAITDGFANAVDGSATGFAEDTITGSSDGLITLKQDFVYVNAGTAGDVAFEIAQNTNNAADLVLKAGSYLNYMRF